MYINGVGSIPDDVIEEAGKILKMENPSGSNFVDAIKYVRDVTGLGLVSSKMIVERIRDKLYIEYSKNEVRMTAIFLCGEDSLKSFMPSFPYISKFEIMEISPGRMTRVYGLVSEVMKMISSVTEQGHFNLYKAEIL